MRDARIDELHEDAQQILHIAQQVMQAGLTETKNSLAERDVEISELKSRISELESQIQSLSLLNDGNRRSFFAPPTTHLHEEVL